ncbi:MAG: 5-oxoprolinase [Desulfobulbus sp.]|nr:MAG: 5-oxoprolinase [Desulfobulbus sp.]
MQRKDKKEKKFRFSIDRGGTFTDLYVEIPGEPGYGVVKLLSEDPANYADAPREGIRRILAAHGIAEKDGLVDGSRIEWIRMGTTVATNALLERKGARTALVTTRGFGDILRIGSQERPDLFDLKIEKPDLLYEAVIEVDERVRLLQPDEDESGLEVVIGRTGERFVIMTPPEPDRVRAQLQPLLDQGITGLAIVFLHGYGLPGHEEMVGRLAGEMGFTQISLSSRVMPVVKMVPRGDTTMVDAYLTPHIRKYLSGFKQGFVDGLAGTNLLFMQSDGGLAPADDFTGSRAILSGPAGGVVGYGLTTFNRETGRPVIGFDMGGTSTDVSRYGGELELTFESRTAGVRIQAPQLDIRTVAAGGGSRLFFENGMFKVGPESAGAHPGPVCYRKNGYLAITDANLVLGRLQADYFPHIFGPDEDQPLDVQSARTAMEKLTARINRFYATDDRSPLTVEETALGFLEVANEVMVRPIREVSVMRGFDIKEHVLATFGGAGSQHACAIARILGISTIFIHRFSGILSACGIGLADTVVEKQEPAALVLSAGAMTSIQRRLDQLQQEAEAELAAQGMEREKILCRRYLNLRYRGTDTALMIEQSEERGFGESFVARYRREFGFVLEEREILVDDYRVRAVGRGAGLVRHRIPVAVGEPEKERVVSCYFSTGWQETDLYLMEKLAAGHRVSGPAIIIQETATIVVEPDCRAKITEFGDVEITVGRNQGRQVDRAVNPVQLSIFSNLFMSIAEQMGRMLQKTAISTNIKERLDFSCALFDPAGNLVANAPHVPVHLGAMSEAVREQIKRCPDIGPGDVLLSNHPAAGGSHLPDITVMTPVFSGGEIIFWVASRGHHADVGGISPGSMPPHSHRLVEEGAAILSFKLVENGIFQEQGIADLLQAATDDGDRWISGTRRLSDNISDLKAQVAANRKGIDLILEMVEMYGLPVVQAYMGHVQAAAEAAVRESLKGLATTGKRHREERRTAGDRLDDGSPIMLAITIDRRDGSAVFDFSGTGPEIWGNLNAPRAVTQSAILYCLRCLVQKDIPLNYGCLLPIRLHIPGGCLLDPSSSAAVVGGNVLTSQRVVDVILKAFGVAAASQGCMNNFTFGNERFGYYETIGGGAGAGPGWHGQSGVHTHMTNTRITDPEILERRYPVLLREFSIRKKSGGRGKFNGGDGLVREVEFLAPLQVAILSERRVFAPYGLAGGEPGKRGENLFFTRDGRVLNLGGKNEISARPGDRIRILTPGGGGYGSQG